MKHDITRALSTALLISLATACVDDAPALTEDERRELNDYLLDAAPEPAHPLDIQFGDRLRLIGYDTSAEEITPGEPFTITWYWQVQRTVGGGWMLFTHIDDDGEGESVRNADGVGETVTSAPIRERYAANRWRGGEWIRDAETLTLPRDWATDRAYFYLGFWRVEDGERLEVTSGPSDGTNRASAATVPVRRATTAAADAVVAPVPVPAARAGWTSGAIVTDGVLDEAEWASAGAVSFVNTLDGSPAGLAASARLLWGEAGLYVGFDVPDTSLTATGAEHDAHLWEEDCVELMIDPDGDGRNYFEIQIAPNGQVFETHYDSRREPGPFGHVEWDAGIVSVGVRPEGALNDAEPDIRYTVEALIPWSAFAYGDMPAASRPAPGSTWRMNLYVMDKMATGARAAGWSAPLEGDFHVPARFGRVTFEAPPAPPPEAAPLPEGVVTGAVDRAGSVLRDATGRPVVLPAAAARMVRAVDGVEAVLDRPGGIEAVRAPETR